MNEEEEVEVEDIKSDIHVEDEDFINALKTTRKLKEEEEKQELKELAQRVYVLQQRLEEAKVKIKREKAFHEIQLIERALMSSNSMFNIEDMEVKAEAKKLSMKSMKLLDELLDREFSQN